jgi:hypothetical protein
MVPANIPGSSPIGHGCTVPGGQDDKCPVTRDCHAGIRGSRRVKPPPATRQLLLQSNIGHERGTNPCGHVVRQRASPPFREPRLVMKREKSQL